MMVCTSEIVGCESFITVYTDDILSSFVVVHLVTPAHVSLCQKKATNHCVFLIHCQLASRLRYTILAFWLINT